LRRKSPEAYGIIAAQGDFLFFGYGSEEIEFLKGHDGPLGTAIDRIGHRHMGC
jgi:hypothetical protein